jgi:hypothetical protein
MVDDTYDDDIGTPTEADLDECYGSKYLGAVNLSNKKIRTRIAKVRKEKMRQQGGAERTKFVIYLTTLDKPMVLNATNKNELVDELGRNPANWVDAEIGLYTVPTQYGGQPTRGLRLRVLSMPKKGTGKATPATAPKPTKPAGNEEEPWEDREDPGNPGDNFREAAE